MRYRKLDEDGDYSFGNGQANFFRDEPAAVAQAVKTRLKLWLGEWFLDSSEGTPYLQGVMGKFSNQTRNAIIRARILSTEGVTKIVTYSSTINPDNRRLIVSVLIDTLYGQVQIEVT